MTHLATTNLIICLGYGVLSVFQTLNSRFLFRNEGFDYYSFVFGIQRVVIIAIFYLFFKIPIDKKLVIRILPYSLFMCLSNLLSSYCITIMPLAAFLSFKKFIVLFILLLGVAFNLPTMTTRFQNVCIAGIVLGGAMVGQKDIFHGNILGYICSLMFNLSQAIVLQYSAFLYKAYKLQPHQLLFYNCIIGLPYYLGVIAYEAQFDDIYYFFLDKTTIGLVITLLISIVLACISELSASYIAMKISPFEKSTISNIKDLVLTLISVQYFHDFGLTMVSGAGILICLISSVLFSLPYIQQKEERLELPQGDSQQRQLVQVEFIDEKIQNDEDEDKDKEGQNIVKGNEKIENL